MKRTRPNTWCPTCHEETLPRHDGTCMWCDSQTEPLERAPEHELAASRAGENLPQTPTTERSLA